MKQRLYYSSRLQRFLGLRKFKKKHRIKLLEKGVNTIEHGYKGKCSYIYWAIIQWDD